MSSNIKLSSRDEVMNATNVIDQVSVLQKNITYIAIIVIRILKSTILKNADFTVYKPTEAVCQFFKFLTMNMCGETSLTAPIAKFISLISQIFLPKQIMNLTLKDFKNLYDEEIRQENINANLDYQPLDKSSISNLRKNLLAFISKMVDHYPELDKSIKIRPLCDVSKYITDKVCEYRYILVPFIILASVLTQMIIPDDVMNEIVNAFKNPTIVTEVTQNNTGLMIEGGRKKRLRKTSRKDYKSLRK
jgi:hypothetical protein